MEIILVLVGAIILFVSIIKCMSIIKIIDKDMKRYWYYVLALILFFFIGYIGYFILELISIDLFTKTIVALVFFFGAIFVLIVLSINLTTISALKQEHKKALKLNDELKKASKTLNKNKRMLEKAKIELEVKNKEMESTLDDFYELRLAKLKKKK